MRGIVVDKEGKPLQFRVHDPSTGTTELGVMAVRGGMVTIGPAPQGQVDPEHPQQYQPHGQSSNLQGPGGRDYTPPQQEVPDQAQPQPLPAHVQPPAPTADAPPAPPAAEPEPAPATA
jgi:hypothetical protein